MSLLRRLFFSGARAGAGVCNNAPSVAVGATQAAKSASTVAAVTTESFLKEAQKTVVKLCTGGQAQGLMNALRSKAAGIIAFLGRNPALLKGSGFALIVALIVYLIYKGVETYKMIRGTADEAAKGIVEQLEMENFAGLGASPVRPLPITIPSNDLCCPISLAPFESPVVVAPSGVSYERKFLEEWMTKNNTDPTTGEVITSVLPNRALKNFMSSMRETAVGAVSAVGVDDILEFVDSSEENVIEAADYFSEFLHNFSARE